MRGFGGSTVALPARAGAGASSPVRTAPINQTHRRHATRSAMSASLVAEGRARAPATVQGRMVNRWDFDEESDAREVRGLDLRSGEPAASGRGGPRPHLAEGLRPAGGAAPR